MCADMELQDSDMPGYTTHTHMCTHTHTHTHTHVHTHTHTHTHIYMIYIVYHVYIHTHPPSPLVSPHRWVTCPKPVFTMYNFGSPRVGNAKFVDQVCAVLLLMIVADDCE